MPRREVLVGWHIEAVKGAEPDGDGMVETWSLLFTDYQTKDQILIGFRREARDELVRQLTGGIVLAGGELPKI